MWGLVPKIWVFRARYQFLLTWAKLKVLNISIQYLYRFVWLFALCQNMKIAMTTLN